MRWFPSLIQAVAIQKEMTKGILSEKIGQILYEKSLEVARFRKMAYLWLGVWEENIKAIRFYEKNGFVAFDKHIFKFGEDEQTDIMMKKVLR
ncbi:GNAT family N-acetyltransferase [Dyadobacter chenwenxiniae]|uniref:GNAT family N-acetyltransferase n=1 Tax=Dyadobacter chenwenxiniae TaxID=2906456 RepID=A0A9X1PNT4_9BACT|nr:GNAT family N-acetyltransferase [Dyadobacter chenwenxiniae]MCF0064792.1 GNAT family N-acetyltransferase [Dyadobacter chenwenxiniae]UON84152.1 GNAT family N-acetyltransferase [Dyadobacter chenwenxiniae]